MKQIDLNVDIGEGFPNDRRLLEFATSANVCCGEHAGSWGLTLETAAMCREKGVRIGMHPGFPDREPMGRRIPSAEEVRDFCESVAAQSLRFHAEVGAAYVKPHGAWYNAMCPSPKEVGPRISGSLIATLTVVVVQCEIRPMLMPGTFVARVMEGAKVKIIAEGFGDRAYLPGGTLKPRSEPGAVLSDPADVKAQVLRIAPSVDSICLHGDTPDCLVFAELVFKTLVDAGYEVGNWA